MEGVAMTRMTMTMDYGVVIDDDDESTRKHRKVC